MRKTLIIFILTAGVLFAQSSALIPYISDGAVGLQINPAIGGVRSGSQETEINAALFYHPKYNIKDDEVLGMIEGRLISETPLSSFDMIGELTRQNALSISNYAENQKAFQEALELFRAYQRGDTNNEYYYYYYEEEIPAEIIIEDAPAPAPAESSEPAEYYYYYYEEYTSALDGLSRIGQKIAAQNIQHQIRTNYTNIVTTNYTGISPEELQQLIYIEKLKEQYNNLIKQYNEMIITQEKEAELYTFDPADPSERFTIVMMSSDYSKMWTKSFSLNGKSNYQSYNSSVWYLGYQLPLTKKDIRELYNVFENSDEVQYLVQGSGGTASFKLNRYFISAMKELLDLYAQGKLIQEQTTTYPLLR